MYLYLDRSYCRIRIVRGKQLMKRYHTH